MCGVWVVGGERGQGAVVLGWRRGRHVCGKGGGYGGEGVGVVHGGCRWRGRKGGGGGGGGWRGWSCWGSNRALYSSCSGGEEGMWAVGDGATDV